VTGALTIGSVALRGAYGAALCAAPGALIGLAGGPPASPQSRAVARVLGIRQLAQAAAYGVALAPRIRPQDRAALLSLGAVVDVLHATSMVGLAVADAPRRRLGLTDAAVAFAFAVSALADLDG
jgi:hypothetical protein